MDGSAGADKHVLGPSLAKTLEDRLHKLEKRQLLAILKKTLL